MSNDMRLMADLAESLALAGHSAEYIAHELRSAADEAEFGWTGAKHFGTDTGVVPPSEADAIADAISELIDKNPRAKTVSKEALSSAIWVEQ